MSAPTSAVLLARPPHARLTYPCAVHTAYGFAVPPQIRVQLSGIDSFVTVSHDRIRARSRARPSDASSCLIILVLQTSSLFDTFRPFGPLLSIKIQSVVDKKGKQVQKGGIWFHLESSTHAAVAALNQRSDVVDPCSLSISRHPNSSTPPWHVAFGSGDALEHKLRMLFPDAIALEVVDFGGPTPRAMGVARFSTPEAAQSFSGDRNLDGLGDARVELTYVSNLV